MYPPKAQVPGRVRATWHCSTRVHHKKSLFGANACKCCACYIYILHRWRYWCRDCVVPLTESQMGISTDAEDGVRRTGSVSHIGNKHKRQDMYQKYRKEKAKRKLQRRLKLAKDERSSKEGKMRRKERLATSKPRTIENTRDFNPTVLNVPNTHEVPAWMEAQQRPEPADRHNDDEEEEEDSPPHTQSFIYERSKKNGERHRQQ